MAGSLVKGGRAIRMAVTVSVVGVALAAACGGRAASAVAAAGPKVCSEAGITTAIVKRVFGSTAKIGGDGVSESGRCAIEVGEHGQPPTDCLNQSPSCANTDVDVSPASAYTHDVAEEVYELNSYGRAHRTVFSGAGAKAVLLTSTKGYGGEASPLLLFTAGTYTVRIGGPFAGDAESPAMFKQWEALARDIHAHLS